MLSSRFFLVVVALVLFVASARGQNASLDLNMKLPEGWQAHQTAQGAVLVPDGGTRHEAYAVMIAPVPAGAALSDPGVFDALLHQLRTQYPALEPMGPASACNVAGEAGVQVVLGGVEPQTRQPVAVGVWIAMSNGRMITLSATGRSDLVAQRLAAMSEVAAGLRCSGLAMERPSASPQHVAPPQQVAIPQRVAPQAAANPNIDPALVGAWQKSNSGSYVSSSYGSPAFSMSTATVTTMYLLPDGSGVCNVRSQMAGGTGSISYDGTGGQGNNYPFAWAARGGVFDMRMQNGTGGPSRYQVSRDTLITYGPKGEQTVYRRVG